MRERKKNVEFIIDISVNKNEKMVPSLSVRTHGFIHERALPPYNIGIIQPIIKRE